MRGCACRGSAGFAHLKCLINAAWANTQSWYTCPTCKQRWTGALNLGLCRARVELAASLPEADVEARLDAATELTTALTSSGEHAEALELGRATLATAQRVIGNESGCTLQAMVALAATHSDVGDHAAALTLQTEGLTVCRRVFGDDHEQTIASMSDLGTMYYDMDDNEAALPLMEEGLERTRRVRGNDHADTMSCMCNLANLHNKMCNYELALPLNTKALEARRRVLGSRHQTTLVSVGSLGVQHGHMGNLDAALPLLEEAVVGLTAACGELHPHTRHFKTELDDLRRDMSDPREVAHAAAHLRQLRAQQHANSAAATPTVVRAHLVSANPDLSGSEVHVLRYKQDKDRYVISHQPEGDDKASKSLCKPSSLRLAVGTPIIAVGLARAPELNGRAGVVEGFDEERVGGGRYSVRFEERGPTAWLKPDNCRAAVRGSEPEPESAA
jgi:hypothetical protein